MGFVLGRRRNGCQDGKLTKVKNVRKFEGIQMVIDGCGEGGDAYFLRVLTVGEKCDMISGS